MPFPLLIVICSSVLVKIEKLLTGTSGNLKLKDLLNQALIKANQMNSLLSISKHQENYSQQEVLWELLEYMTTSPANSFVIAEHILDLFCLFNFLQTESKLYRLVKMVL